MIKEDVFSIFDCEVGTELIINFNFNDKNYEFPTRIIHNNGHLLLEPVKINGQLLGFGNESFAINLILNRKDDKPIIWKMCKLTTVRNENRAAYHLLSCRDGVLLNRRGAFRVYLGFDADVSLGAHMGVEGVIAKNISSTGLAFTADKKLEFQNENDIRIVFEDKSLNYYFDLNVRLVRHEELENGKIVYGGILNKGYPLLQKYISERQLDDLQKNNLTLVEMRNRQINKKVKKVIR